MLKIQFTGHHVEVTDAIRDLTEKKLTKLEKHANNISHVEVTFEVSKLEQIAKATVYLPGHQLFASATSDDMYKSIDAMVGKLDKQLLKHK